MVFEAFWQILVHDLENLGQGQMQTIEICSGGSRMIFGAFWPYFVCGLQNLGQGHMQEIEIYIPGGFRMIF